MSVKNHEVEINVLCFLGACRVLEHIFHCFEANSHFVHMSCFGTCGAFVTFIIFETMMLADFISIFCEYTKNSKKKLNIFKSVFMYHINIQILKIKQKTFFFIPRSCDIR